MQLCKRIIGSWLLWVLVQSLIGCAAAPMMAPVMEPVRVQQQAAPSAQPLENNYFASDRTGNLSEEQLRKILDAPVFLEDKARVGIVPVATAYELDGDIPLVKVPHALSDALESTGYFEVTTEVSTDWPSTRSIAGLRELAARYRVKYLLLYRHRFVDRARPNAWSLSWLTLVGGMMTPARTLEAAGVMEASLFDVRTGTILFTVFERVDGAEKVTIWQNDRKRRTLKEGLLAEGTRALADQVVHKVQGLAVARETWEQEQEELKSTPSAEPARGEARLDP